MENIPNRFVGLGIEQRDGEASLLYQDTRDKPSTPNKIPRIRISFRLTRYAGIENGFNNLVGTNHEHGEYLIEASG
jgi:hypothetical protein